MKKHWPSRITAYGKSLLHLFFPRLCAGCHRNLHTGETGICLVCMASLPRTLFTGGTDHALHKIFWGRVEIRYATALLAFRRGGITQRLIHGIKYHAQHDTARVLGMELGRCILHMQWQVDVIVPVPLTRERYRQRGYNQSEWIAREVAEILGVPCETFCVLRSGNRKSQTRKGRYERWLNADHSFRLADPMRLAGKHVLVVDDVITTGATLEAIAALLTNLPDCRVSVAALAFSVRS
ncbi:MAG: ComF family protein [Flavobacteriales bacterium]|nr:ComF family protein [Flavobacteriales bacterium]MCB9449697.1 ComF family protein [Flavobacteriales bacterium]